MFYSQPLAARFGTELTTTIASGEWSRIDIAVAWVRASGIKHLRGELEAFLGRGGRMSLTVGVDFENTSTEGLQALLDLEAHGNSRSWVHHNEADTVFHPKLYLFRSSAGRARLIVGSNNLTEAGLYKNTEAGLQLDLPTSDPVIESAIAALKSWRDISSGLARRLDNDLLAQLVANGYVRSEAALRRERSERRRSTGGGSRSARLFGSVPVSAPTIEDNRERTRSASSTRRRASTVNALTPAARSTPGTVLLMRVRRASATARRTQTQMPKALTATDFFDGVTKFVSARNGDEHTLREASARGIVNTLKLEIPEIRDLEDPVVRFERVGDTVRYEAYDRDSAKGTQIFAALEEGRRNDAPNPTFLTRPSDPLSSTWWRFI